MINTSPLAADFKDRQIERSRWLPSTIISGGQTGVDRAALDWAIRHQIPHGGWCPNGRRADDGVLAAHYELWETISEGYRQRTRLNVQDSDATLVFNLGALDGGTLQTVVFAKAMNRPYLVIQLGGVAPEVLADQARSWLAQRRVAILNIAGPREQKRPGIYMSVMTVLNALIDR